MEECETSVTLGSTVCAESENAEVCIKAIRFGMGANAIASGRKPSMLRMITRRISGNGVSVGDSVFVDVGVNAMVGTRVDIEVGLSAAGNVGIEVGVSVRVDNWHAIKSASRTA